MKNVFIVPTGSNLVSRTNINLTLVKGVSAKTIKRFVEVEISDDICFVWGCKSHNSGLRNWEAMQSGDLILFYQKKSIQYVAKVIQKFKSKECGDVIWEPDSDHVPFELNYLITQPIKTEVAPEFRTVG